MGVLVTLVLAKDYVGSYILFPRGILYTYNDVFTNTQGYHSTRIFGQEAMQTFLFTIVFLAIRMQSYFQKSNILVKGLVLAYVQAACFSFCFGAGSCLNPAIGLVQSIYAYFCYDSRIPIGTPNPYLTCSWIYLLAPFAGAILAAVVNQYHQSTTERVEMELERHHVQKLSESRSVDKIDVEDTRSRQSDLFSK